MKNTIYKIFLPSLFAVAAIVSCSSDNDTLQLPVTTTLPAVETALVAPSFAGNGSIVPYSFQMQSFPSATSARVVASVAGIIETSRNTINTAGTTTVIDTIIAPLGGATTGFIPNAFTLRVDGVIEGVVGTDADGNPIFNSAPAANQSVAITSPPVDLLLFDLIAPTGNEDALEILFDWTNPGGNDLDLDILDSAGNSISGGATGSRYERATILNSTPDGTFTVQISAFSADDAAIDGRLFFNTPDGERGFVENSLTEVMAGGAFILPITITKTGSTFTIN